MGLKLVTESILPCFSFADELHSSEFYKKWWRRWWRWLLVPLISAGCLQDFVPDLTAPTAEPPPQDAADLVRGICFEAAFDAAGQVFVLRSAEDLIRLYDLADHSRLCRRPVARVPFILADDQVVIGTWSAGVGCTARHEIESLIRDEAARRMTLSVRFETEGDCPYELVRPFWLVLDQAAGYELELILTP
jgi:hypothetical protein